MPEVPPSVESDPPRLRAPFVAVFALVVGGAFAWGPLLPWAIRRVAAASRAAESPGRLYLCAQAQRAMKRPKAARKTLELWIHLYAREEGRDWGPLLSGETEFVYRKYELGEGLHEKGFAPWCYAGGRRSRPVAAVSDTLLGRVLLDYVGVLEDEKEYAKAAHVVTCLLHLWPRGSKVHAEAEDAFWRAYGGRSF